MKSKTGEWWLLGLPLLICLPCLLPGLAAAVLAAGGAGVVSSFVSDNAFLMAILAAFAALVALVVGLAASRLARGRRVRPLGFSRMVEP